MPLFGPPSIEKLKRRKDVAALAQRLEDDDAQVRREAVVALGELRDRRTISVLLTALDDEAPEVRREAAWAIGLLREADLVDYELILEPLSDAAEYDDDQTVRLRASWAMDTLGVYADLLGIDALLVAVRDERAEVCEAAIHAVGLLTDKDQGRRAVPGTHRDDGH